MTLWLDKSTVRTQVGDYIGGEIDEITEEKRKSGRVRVQLKFKNNVRLSSSDLRSVEQYLRSIGSGDPELILGCEDGTQTICIEADSNVYRSD